MPIGRVLLTGAPDDPLLIWLRARLQQVGYLVLDLVPTAVRAGMSAISLPAVAGLDLWREVSEERQQAIKALDAQLPPGVPLLTRCTWVQAEEVAAYTPHRSRVVGFSLFGPPEDELLIELLPAVATTPEALRRGALFLRSANFQTETLPPGSWAVYPRIISMIVNEAAFAIGEDVASAADIDLAMRLGANYAQGPLALADGIGLDQILAVLEALQREYGDDRYRPAPLLRRLVRAGYLGKIAGRGFHVYPSPAPTTR